jgi:hypothetical protein
MESFRNLHLPRRSWVLEAHVEQGNNGIARGLLISSAIAVNSFCTLAFS